MTAGDEANRARAIELHSEVASDFDKRYQAIEENPYASTFLYGRRKIEQLIGPILAKIPPGSAALDVGCGTGFNAARLVQHGLHVVGIEPSEDMRRLAKANAPGADIRAGDIEHLTLESASFDLVLAIEVIRYMIDPGPALAELRRVVRPQGIAIVTAAPRWSMNGYAMVHAVTSRVKVPTFHKLRQSFLSAAGGQRAMRAAGFSDVEVHGAFLGPWSLLGRVSPRALAAMLRVWEPIDDRLSDRPVLRDLTNHLVFVGRG